MTRLLIIGLVWLSVSAFVGVLIGVAIHRADLRDEQFPEDSTTEDSTTPDRDDSVAVLPPPVRTRHLVHRRRPSRLLPPTDDGTPRQSRPG